MRKHLLIAFIAPIAVFAQENNGSMKKEPVADKKPKQLTIHGHTRMDDYFWMNERDSKPVLDHLSKENAYTAEYFKSLEPLKNALLDEFEKRIDPNDMSAPFVLNQRTYQVELPFQDGSPIVV